MATVVCLGPVPLGLRRTGRMAELERVFGTAVELVEASSIREVRAAIAEAGVIGVAD